MAATYYYRLYAKASALSKPPLAVQRFLHGRSWSPAFWWTGIVWATAATAIHNVQQMDTLTSVDASWPGPISLEEDPIAYLGILVDVLEEWDRYSVFKGLNREPIQGTEVQLGYRDQKVVVRFEGGPGRGRARKLSDELDKALIGWTSLLEVQP